MYMNATADAAARASTAATPDSSSLGLTIDRLVIYDVLMPPHPRTHQRPQGLQNKTFWDKCCLISYQLVLAGTFLLHRYIPIVCLTWLYDVITNAVLSLCNMYPISHEDRVYIQNHWKKNSLGDRQKSWYMSYPYFQFWKHVFQGKLHDLDYRLALPKDLSKVPVLYLYGSSKPYDLSDPNAVELLKREQAEGGASRVVQVDAAGHWLYAQQPDLCYESMTQFFEATIPYTKAKNGMVPSSGVAVPSKRNPTNRGGEESNLESQKKTTKPTPGFTLCLPKDQAPPSCGSSDSMSTVQTTSMWHQSAQTEEVSNVELCGAICSVTSTGGQVVENDDNLTECNNDGSTKCDDSANSNNSANSDEKSSGRHRSFQKQQASSQKRVNVAALVEASMNSPPLQEDELWKSKAAMKLYAVVFLSVSLRRLFILQGISLLILFHFMKLLFLWLIYVNDAKEIREFQGLAVWWIKFGLRFTAKTIEGDTIHRIVTAFTLNFWKGTGISLLKILYHSIVKDTREQILRHAKDNLKRTQISHMKWKMIRQKHQRASR
jgi:pimeloyl-ACP methyl ester carboxylesterase